MVFDSYPCKLDDYDPSNISTINANITKTLTHARTPTQVLPPSAVRSLHGVGSGHTWPISVPVSILKPWELLTTPALESQDLPVEVHNTTPQSARKRKNESESKLRRAAHSSRDVFVLYSLDPCDTKKIVSHRSVGFTKRVRRAGVVVDVRIMSKISDEHVRSVAKLCGDVKGVIENESTHAELSRLGGIERILDHFMEHESPSLTIRLLRLFLFSGLSIQDEIGQLESFKVLASSVIHNKIELDEKFVDIAVRIIYISHVLEKKSEII